jgi:AcrR family transcriptional regulator
MASTAQKTYDEIREMCLDLDLPLALTLDFFRTNDPGPLWGAWTLRSEAERVRVLQLLLRLTPEALEAVLQVRGAAIEHELQEGFEEIFGDCRAGEASEEELLGKLHAFVTGISRAHGVRPLCSLEALDQRMEEALRGLRDLGGVGAVLRMFRLSRRLATRYGLPLLHRAISTTHRRPERRY